MSKIFYENKPYIDEPQKFQKGETVVITNHSPIWLGYSGEVIGFAKGLHQIRVEQKPSGVKLQYTFLVEIPGSDLEVWL